MCPEEVRGEGWALMRDTALTPTGHEVQEGGDQRQMSNNQRPF